MTGGEIRPALRAAGAADWENEGGSLAQPAAALPNGIVPIAVTHYRVGPYTYNNLADAAAQYNRQEHARS